jgi:hypothetical protein
MIEPSFSSKTRGKTTEEARSKSFGYHYSSIGRPVRPYLPGTSVRQGACERRTGGYRECKGSIAADESNSLTQDGIARAGGVRQCGKEEEIRSWAERWKDKRTSRKKGKQRQPRRFLPAGRAILGRAQEHDWEVLRVG